MEYLETDFDFESEKLLDLFDELPMWAAPFGLSLLDKIIYRKGITALDIGFGAGFPLTEIAMRLGNTSKVYGIDPWKAASARTQRKLDFYGIKNVELINGTSEFMPLNSNHFDLVVSNNGLNNVMDLGKSIEECARIMKPEAQLVFTVNLNGTMVEFYALMESVLRELACEKELNEMQEQIYRQRKPLEEYIKLLKTNGFEIKSANEDRFEYRFVDGTALLNHHFIRLAFLDGWKSFIPKNKLNEVFAEVEKRMNKEAEENNGFCLSVPFVTIDCRKTV